MPTAISVSYRGNTAVLKVEGWLGIDSRQLVDAVDESLRKGFKNLVLDLSGTTYIDSTGLAVLVTAYTRASNQGGRLAIASLQEKVRQTLQITKLYSVIPPYDSVDAAVVSLTRPEP